MQGREQRIQDEVTALWRELFGEPPPVQARGEEMLDAIMKSLPAKDYTRLASPHLRPSRVSGPNLDGQQP